MYWTSYNCDIISNVMTPRRSQRWNLARPIDVNWLDFKKFNLFSFVWLRRVFCNDCCVSLKDHISVSCVTPIIVYVRKVYCQFQQARIFLDCFIWIPHKSFVTRPWGIKLWHIYFSHKHFSRSFDMYMKETIFWFFLVFCHLAPIILRWAFH